MDLPTELRVRFAQLPAGPRWWVALSGGVDSLTLLHWLVLWRRDNPDQVLAAAHVNHGLYDAANEWAEHCKRVCNELSVPLKILHVDGSADRGGLGPEGAARAARYVAFESVLAADELLIQAHHQDDQAETVLFRLLRGAGPRGLAGIPRRRRLGKGWIHRPLLDIPRADILAWSTKNHIDAVDDPANTDPRFDRSFLRHHVMPLLETRWPGYRAAMARSANLQSLLADELQGSGAEHLARASTFQFPVPEVIDEPALATQLYRWLIDVGVLPPSQCRLAEFARQVAGARADRIPELLLGTCALRCWRSVIYMDPVVTDTLPEAGSVRVGQQMSGEWGRLDWTRADAGGLGFPENTPLSFRSRVSGERVRLLGRPGRSLTQCLQEAGIPPWWRDLVPMITDEHDRLLGIPGAGATDHATRLVVPGGFLPFWTPPQPTHQLSH